MSTNLLQQQVEMEVLLPYPADAPIPSPPVILSAYRDKYIAIPCYMAASKTTYFF